jgi:hypothetical protein
MVSKVLVHDLPSHFGACGKPQSVTAAWGGGLCSTHSNQEEDRDG